MKRHPRAHLVTGSYDAAEKLLRHDRSHASLLKELAAAICRHGDYAVTTLRNFEDGDLVMIGIAYRRDADRLAGAVDANVAPRFGGWLTHRSFSFDAGKLRRTSRSERIRSGSDEGSGSRRVRARRNSSRPM
jgi:hypothetical protein